MASTFSSAYRIYSWENEGKFKVVSVVVEEMEIDENPLQFIERHCC